MMNKIKKTLGNAKDSAGRNINYAKGKSSGFTHPEAVEPHIIVLRSNKEQIPKLYERVVSLASHHKDLAGSENKAHAEFLVGGGNEQENKVLLQWFKAFAESQLAISEARLIYHSVLEEIRVDMKIIKEKDLQDIQVIHDKVNHALTDARYWRKNANPTKLSESESRYKQFICELIDMKNRLLELKETKYPEYVSNWVRAQLEFYRICLQAAERLDDQLRQIGPVPLTPTEPFNPNLVDLGSGDIGHDDDDGPSHHHSTSPSPSSQQQGPPPINRGPPPQIPSHHGPRARANYAFTAGSPQELSFNPGDVMNILEQQGDWWMAEINGRRGLIPSNYVSLV